MVHGQIKSQPENIFSFPKIDPPLRAPLPSEINLLKSIVHFKEQMILLAKEKPKPKFPPEPHTLLATDINPFFDEDEELIDFYGLDEEDENWCFYEEGEENIYKHVEIEKDTPMQLKDIDEDFFVLKLMADAGINEEALFYKLQECNQKRRKPLPKLYEEQKRLSAIDLYCQLKADRQKARGEPVKLTDWDRQVLPELSAIEKELTIP